MHYSSCSLIQRASVLYSCSSALQLIYITLNVCASVRSSTTNLQCLCCDGSCRLLQQCEHAVQHPDGGLHASCLPDHVGWTKVYTTIFLFILASSYPRMQYCNCQTDNHPFDLSAFGLFQLIPVYSLSQNTIALLNQPKSAIFLFRA